MLQTIAITIHGKVQGVFYRQSTCEKARELGITGYVENKPDDTVFIKATGTPGQLDALIRWCHQGPPRANVKAVETATAPLQTFAGFTILR